MYRDPHSTRGVAVGLTTLLAAGALGCSTLRSDEAEPAIITESDRTEQEATGSLQGDLPPGTELEIRLDRPLSSEESEAGDRWSGVLAHDVTDGTRVLLSEGAVVSGEVTRAGRAEVEGEMRQVLALDPQTLHVVGDELSIDAEVVRAEAETREEGLSRENIAIVGGGAAAGAILGEIFFDEALLGALLGGAGGTVVAIATADTEIVLEEGSELTLRLQESVQVAGARQ